MAELTELLRGIKQLWDSDDAAAAREQIPGDLWVAEAPAVTARNKKTYCVLRVQPGTVFETNTSIIEEGSLEFTIYSTSEETTSQSDYPCYVARDALIRLLDNTTAIELTDDIDGNKQRVIRFNREMVGSILKDPDEGYFTVVQYSCMYG